MILPIYIYGQPVLRKEAQDIPADYPGLQQLISDMYETLTQADGIGLAAPQIGKDIRVVVIDLTPLAEDMPEYADFRHAYINAHIVEYDDTKTETMEEGCLSLPGISGWKAIWPASCSTSSTTSMPPCLLTALVRYANSSSGASSAPCCRAASAAVTAPRRP